MSHDKDLALVMKLNKKIKDAEYMKVYIGYLHVCDSNTQLSGKVGMRSLQE